MLKTTFFSFTIIIFLFNKLPPVTCSSGVTHLTIYYRSRSTDDVFSRISINDTSLTSYKFTSLVHGVEHEFFLKLTTSGGESKKSERISVRIGKSYSQNSLSWIHKLNRSHQMYHEQFQVKPYHLRLVNLGCGEVLSYTGFYVFVVRDFMYSHIPRHKSNYYKIKWTNRNVSFIIYQQYDSPWYWCQA